MKKTLLSTVFLAVIRLGVFAQDVNIPDANFKAYLVGNTNINTNGDTEIQVSEANDFTGTININNDGVNDLTGIEHFINLTYLIAPFNQLTSIDVSQNTALLSLNVQDNMLTSLDISQNTALTGLNCGRNNLSSLDVSQNVLLEFLLCHENNLSALDVYPLTKLITFNCSQNSITSLDFSQNTGINQNTTLEIPFLHCQENNLTVLKMNGISPGSLQNQYFNATSNPNLTCIEVNDVASAETNWTNIDATASFSLQCTVDIPDANFKAYLVGNTSINTNGDSEIQVSEAAAFTGTINCTNLGISDLTGIEAFTALTKLYCEDNSALTAIDVSNNTALIQLRCANNALTALDVSNNTALTQLNCHANSLATLDVSNNVDLMFLSCYSNSLTNLDVSNNTALTSLNCGYNAITDLDVSNLSDLELLSCSSNSLTELDVSNNTALASFYCHDNAITDLNVSNNPALDAFICHNNSLTAIDVTNNTNLTQLRCDNNPLTILNAANGNNTDIYFFYTLNTPNLTCIQVDDVSYSTTNWTDIDPASGFSLDCQVLVNSITVQGEAGATAITTDEGTLQMEATVLPANADDASYTWSVTNGSGEATIDTNGLLTAVSNGTVTVTATANDGSGVTGDATITISNQIVLISSITVQGENGATTIDTNGGTQQMEASVLPANATDATYTWSVTNGTGEATIDENGLLTAIADGTVTVTATANDGSGVTGDATITISNQIVLGTPDQGNTSEVVIHPNPIKSWLYITTNSTIESIVIVDLAGKKIQTVSSPKNSIDISRLEKGIYTLLIKTTWGLESKKFIKE